MRRVLGTIAVGLPLIGCAPPPPSPTDSTDSSGSTETSTSSTSSSSTTSTTTGTTSTTGPTADSTSTAAEPSTSETTAGSSTSTTTGSTTTGSTSTSETTSGTTSTSATDSGTTTDAGSSSSDTGFILHPLRVFVTSQTHNGGYGGTAGADTLCNDLASAAALGGTFTAWLSTSTEDAATRIDPTGTPYVLVDGTIIAADIGDLLDGSLDAPINVDETGVMVFGDVWTGTLPDGTAAPVHCLDWTEGASPITGRCGSTATMGPAWTDNITPTCGAGLRLYCFEQS